MVARSRTTLATARNARTQKVEIVVEKRITHALRNVRACCARDACSARTTRVRSGRFQKRTGARWASRTKKRSERCGARLARVNERCPRATFQAQNGKRRVPSFTCCQACGSTSPLWRPQVGHSVTDEICVLQLHRISPVGSAGLRQRGVRPSALMADPRVTHSTPIAQRLRAAGPASASAGAGTSDCSGDCRGVRPTSLRLVPSVRRGLYRVVGRARTRSTALMSNDILDG